MGSKFPLGVVTTEELQNVMGMGKDELEGILKGMMKKGLVTTVKKHGQTRYILSMGMGVFEFTFMRTDESLPLKRLAEFMNTYRNTAEFVQEFFSPGPAELEPSFTVISFRISKAKS